MPRALPRRLAIFGTFDVENYGDLLFPLIAQQRLSDAGIEVVAVSPTANATRYNDALSPISQTEFARNVDRFDGVLIGGGNIIHTNEFALPNYTATAYPALWVGATAYAVRHGLPVIWNSPGVLLSGEDETSPDWLRRTVAAADRFVVRDSDSAEALAKWSGRRPALMPDTALDLARLWPSGMMKDRFRRIRANLNIPDDVRVVALHVKERSLNGLDLTAFTKSLSAALRDNGAVAILLAIGRCHGDHRVAQSIHHLAPDCTFSLDESTALADIAAAIAGANAYLGASLHGHITAAAYGVASRLVAVPALYKFMGQATQMNRMGDVVCSWAEALEALTKVLTQSSQPLPQDVSEKLDAHWNDVTRLLTAGRKHPRRADVFPGSDLDASLEIAIRHARAARPRGTASMPDPLHARHIRKGNLVTENTQMKWDSAVIDRMISEGNLDAAAEQIAIMLGQVPDFLPARLAEVRATLAQGDAARAIELAADLSSKRPENSWVWLANLQSLLAGARHQEAITLFLDGLNRLEFDESLMVTALNDLLTSVPPKQQVSFLKSVHAQRPESTVVQLRLAMRAYASGDRGLAIDMLDRAEQAGPLPAYAARVKSQLLPFAGTMDAATDHLLSNWKAGVENVEILCRLCRFAAAAGRFDVTENALRRTLELYPLEWRSIYRLNRVFLSHAEDAAIFQQLAVLDATQKPGANWRLQFALFALRAGQEDFGRAALEGLAGDDATGPTARSLLAALDALGAAAPRAPVIADAHVRVVEKADARGTLIVFGGFLGGLSHVNDRYLDALLAKLPANIVYLRDPYARVYLNGIPDLGSDEHQMQSALLRLVAELGGGRLITMGGSAAGYAALRSGLAIGADKVISLAGFVTPGPVGQGEPIHSQRGMEELFETDLDTFDLCAALAAQPKTRLIQVIGGAYAPDVARAQALDGLDNAQVHVMQGVDTHHVALPAIADGTLRRLLENAFEV